VTTRAVGTAEFEKHAEQAAWFIVVAVSCPIAYAAWLLHVTQPVVTFMLCFVILTLVTVQGIRWFFLPFRSRVRPNREYVVR